MALIDKLQAFSELKKIEFTVDILTKEFEDIAKTLLYDGYILVRNDYRIYIRTVEFYFHAEKDSNIHIFDPIVYHRSGRFPGRTIPYFPLMTLHAHMSGFDITFENESQKYRASALIREYAIYDNQGNFIETKTGHKYDDRSTFLYDFVNGFSMMEGKNDILWVDEITTANRELKKPSLPRVNVYRYNYAYKETGKEVMEKTKERDTRPWRFTKA